VLTIPANHPHYAMARGETVVQVHGKSPVHPHVHHCGRNGPM